MAMHPGEIAIPDEVARDLVDAQFPQWRELPVRRLATAGTVNAIFRIGDGLAARLPLRDGDPGEVAASLRQEAAAAATLAEHSPFPVPRPVAIGAPGPGYPLPWSVQTWLPGITATDADPGSSLAFAEDLSTLITAMRQAGTQGKRFSGEGRGGHLPAHDAWMEECFRKSEGLLDVTRARALWARLRELPDPGRDVMSHKDLIPGNLLVAGGRLAGILDTGGFGLPTRRWTWSPPGTCWKPVPGPCCASGSAATRPSGSAGRHGRLSRRWACPGTTPTAIRR